MACEAAQDRRPAGKESNKAFLRGSGALGLLNAALPVTCLSLSGPLLIPSQGQHMQQILHELSLATQDVLKISTTKFSFKKNYKYNPGSK